MLDEKEKDAVLGTINSLEKKRQEEVQLAIEMFDCKFTKLGNMALVRAITHERNINNILNIFEILGYTIEHELDDDSKRTFINIFKKEETKLD